MAEWTIAPVLKTVEPARVPGVRIPLSPLVRAGQQASIRSCPEFSGAQALAKKRPIPPGTQPVRSTRYPADIAWVGRTVTPLPTGDRRRPSLDEGRRLFVLHGSTILSPAIPTRVDGVRSGQMKFPLPDETVISVRICNHTCLLEAAFLQYRGRRANFRQGVSDNSVETGTTSTIDQLLCRRRGKSLPLALRGNRVPNLDRAMLRRSLEPNHAHEGAVLIEQKMRSPGIGVMNPGAFEEVRKRLRGPKPAWHHGNTKSAGEGLVAVGQRLNPYELNRFNPWRHTLTLLPDIESAWPIPRPAG